MLTAREVITVDPEILGGKPVFRGTRVAIQTLFDHLEERSLDDFLTGYPSVDRKQAQIIIELAAKMIVLDIGRNVLSNLEAYIPILLDYLDKPLRKEMIILSLLPQKA